MDKVQKIREEVEKRFEQIKNSKRESDSGAFYQLKELLEFIDSMQEEPISEELEEASEKCIKELIPEAELNSATPFALEYVVKLLHETFKAGAKWQKKQDQSIIELAEDHAMLAGMEKMKEEMMEKAVELCCEWLENHNDYQRVLDNCRGVRFDMTQCVIDLRKAMQEK